MSSSASDTPALAALAAAVLSSRSEKTRFLNENNVFVASEPKEFVRQALISAFGGGSLQPEKAKVAASDETIVVSPNGTIEATGDCATMLAQYMHRELAVSVCSGRDAYKALDRLNAKSSRMWQVRTEPDGTRIFTPVK